MLKKEFKRADVERVRNLIKGEYNAKTKTSVGYDKKTIEVSEGDVWEEGGKVWTMRNGIKISVNKHTLAKKYTRIPLTCPSCSKPMKSMVDKKMWKMHSICMDCVSQFEQDLKKVGKWEEYEKSIIENNINGFVGDLKIFINDIITETTGFVSEDGKEETWSKNTEQFKVDIYNRLNNYLEHTYTTYNINGST